MPPQRAAAFEVAVPADFAFKATVQSHGWYRLAPFRWDEDSRTLFRIEELDGRAREIAFTATPGKLVVRGAARTPTLLARIRRMFQLDVDIADFLVLTHDSPPHAWVAASGFGRLLCGATVFEDAVKMIATTNTTWKQTVRMVELLSGYCGTRTAAGAAFPRPQQIARFGEEELQRECRLGYRAKTILALSRGVADGSIELDRLADPAQPTETLRKAYLSLPGIGPYGAAHLLAMDGRHDHIAVDTEFRRFVRQTYHSGRQVGDATMLRRYAKWGRWKYLAYWAELWNER
jgi:3-methyladenine DNA glycosylase/8-oxoguanine DNA glycosylase